MRIKLYSNLIITRREVQLLKQGNFLFRRKHPYLNHATNAVRAWLK